MKKYKWIFYLNNILTEEVATAYSPTEARKIIQMRYPNCNINWSRFEEVKD